MVTGIIEVTLATNPYYIMERVEKIEKYNQMSKKFGLPVRSALIIDEGVYNVLIPSDIQKINEVTSAGAYIFVIPKFRDDAFSKLNELNKALRAAP